VTVRDVIGDERDRIYAEQARRYRGFAEYEPKLKVSGPSLCSIFGARRRVMESIRLDEGYASYVHP